MQQTEELKSRIDTLCADHILPKEDLILLLENRSDELQSYAADKASAIRDRIYGREVYARGLIEFTNYCRNDCYYCGIRCSNKAVSRYRLGEDDILSCADEGYALGFRTFVLQGGEDPFFTDDILCRIIGRIKDAHPDCALTLSIGERSYESYKRLFDAGADRYLLRHETANEAHYSMLHPKTLSLKNRMECLRMLKDIGYQVGAGFMVGSPGQTKEYLAEDLLFLHELKPHMTGIGPFIPQHDTPFKDEKQGTLEETLFLLSLIRLMLPEVLLPATTALGTIHPRGRELGILAGANVVMPNLSPMDVRKKYLLYDNKLCTGDEAAECRNCLEARLSNIGFRLSMSRGDHITYQKTKEGN